MHREISSIILLIALLFSPLSFASAQDSTNIAETPVEMPWDVRLKQSLAPIAKEADNNYYYTSFAIWDLTADSMLFSYNSQKLMRPASTEKLVTAVSALSILGPKYKYKTRAFYTGNVTKDSILRGDIYVVGAFDPSYSYFDLQELAQSVRSLNIKGIEGHLYADISMKDSLLYGKGWCWDDVPSSNTPYLCPLMLERGQIAPFEGKYSTSATFHPAIYFMQILGKELCDFGCDTLSCSLKTLSDSVSAHLFYSKTTKLADLLPRMMKTSDNLYAESMFFHISHKNKGCWATWKDAATQLYKTLDKAGADTTYVEIADGSGVSLYNYISVQAEVALLRYAYEHRKIYKHLFPSLPIAGVDGSLQNRMKDSSACGKVNAKTGTVSGVSSLAGYVEASNGHILAFSIINNGLKKVATGRAFQDRICQILCE